MDPQGDATPLSSDSPQPHDESFLHKLQAEMRKLSETQKECNQSCIDSRDKLEKELRAAHIKQGVLFDEKLAKVHKKQADLQESFKLELLKEQRKYGGLITGLQQELLDQRKQQEKRDADQALAQEKRDADQALAQEKRDADQALAQEKRDSRLDSQLALITKQLQETTAAQAQERKDHAKKLDTLSSENDSIISINTSLVEELNVLTARYYSLEERQTQTEEGNVLLNATVDDIRSWLVSKVFSI